MVLSRFMCVFNKHRPKRSSAQWDGVAYVGSCKSCGADIRRVSKGNWKKDRPDYRSI